MKKTTIIATLTMALCLSLALPFSAQARFRGLSAGPGPNAAQSFGPGPGAALSYGTGLGFVDENGDGICDWAQSAEAWDLATSGQYGDYIDEDGDGICDNYADRPLDGTGLGYRGGR